MDSVQVAEVKSARWQRIFASVVFGVTGACSLPFLRAVVQPRAARLAAHVFENGAADFACGIGLAAFCFWGWWRTERYRVRADHYGIEQQTGFRTTRVEWQEVAYYRMERLRGTRERFTEPVLYDQYDRVLLLPVAPIVVGTRRQDDERRRFWAFVIDRLCEAGIDERHGGIT